MLTSVVHHLHAVIFVLLWQHVLVEGGQFYVDDTQGLGRRFYGIGAISGGGATSKLLVNYAEPYRSQILNYLFKPNFGASLHILKVEIGGDSQSTDGSESSHMHSAADANYNRGYEWWLMKKAKQLNPSIKLYGLPWVWPGWLGGDDFNPFTNRTNTVHYIVNWVKGAKVHHNLTIDYIGIWNERAYDIQYIKMLRSGLDRAGFQDTRLVVADGEWGIVSDLLKDQQLLAAIDFVGVHYPSTIAPTPPEALLTDRPLWASEDYSAFNDDGGGAFWARILSENYVKGYLSSVIAWNLIASYYDNINYARHSLMTANEPWSGHYEVSSPIWMSAHYTQFCYPGWSYLLHGLGVGNLTSTGSFISLTSPDRKNLTIIIQTMDPNFSAKEESGFNIQKQAADFILKGSFKNITRLHVWYSKLTKNGHDILFEKRDPIKVTNGQFSMILGPNELITLTTMSKGHKGSHPDPPVSAPFPSNYSDDFESYHAHGEPYNLAQQAGSFEVVTFNTTQSYHKTRYMGKHYTRLASYHSRMARENQALVQRYEKLAEHHSNMVRNKLGEHENITIMHIDESISDTGELPINVLLNHGQLSRKARHHATVARNNIALAKMYSSKSKHHSRMARTGLWKSDTNSPGKVLAQMAPIPPVDTCLPDRMPAPVIIMGNYKWSDINVSVDTYIPASSAGSVQGAFLGARVQTAGCYTMYSNGVFFWVNATGGSVSIAGNYTKSLLYAGANVVIPTDKWFTMGLKIQENIVTAKLNNQTVLSVYLEQFSSSNGFIGFGSDVYGKIYFDNFNIDSSKICTNCSVSSQIRTSSSHIHGL